MRFALGFNYRNRVGSRNSAPQIAQSAKSDPPPATSMCTTSELLSISDVSYELIALPF